MPFASDTFTDTAGTDLASHAPSGGGSWTLHGSYSTGAAVVSDANRVRRSGSSGTLYYHSGTPAGAEYDVTATVRLFDAGTAVNAGPAGRVATAANTCYHARAAYGTGWQLYKFVGGTATLLGTYSTTLATGQDYVVKLELRDALKKVWVDGVDVGLTSTDNVVTAAGKAGFRWATGGGASSDSNHQHLDTFSADDASAGVTGTLAVTLGAVTLAATGAVPVAGSLGVTLGAVTLSAQGAVGVAGQLAQPLGAVTLSAAGVVGAIVTGSLSATLAPVTLSAQGVAPAAGTFAQTLGPVTLSAQAVAVIRGQLAAALGPALLAAAATGPPPPPPAAGYGGPLNRAGRSVGKLRHPLRLERPVVSLDEFRQPVPTWQVVADPVWCEVEELGGDEAARADAAQAALSHAVTLRYRPGVTPGMRLVWPARGGLVLNVVAVPATIGASNLLELRCRSGG